MNEFKIFLLILGAGESPWAHREYGDIVDGSTVSLYPNFRDFKDFREIAWATNTSKDVKSLAQFNVRRKP